jgi:TPR repeat protein
MHPLIITALILLLSSPAGFSAESDAPVDENTKPAEAAPKPEKKTPPKPLEYDKLNLSTLQKKADAGDLKAQFELGSRYNYGRTLPKNTREALYWLRKAAQAGHVEAQRLLAVKLFEGHDLPVDFEEAFKWAQRLAESGDKPGQLMLGNMYANGEGTARSLVRAYMWFDIAATAIQGKDPDEAAKQLMETAATARDKTADLLQPDEEVEAQQLASDWWLSRQKAVKAAPKKKASTPRKKTKSNE